MRPGWQAACAARLRYGKTFSAGLFGDNPMMTVYQIHRLKESQRQTFRSAPHTSGVSVAKQKDYEPGSTVESESPYAAWKALAGTENALHVGDILESPAGELRIYKYVGFEEARWYIPEPMAPAVVEAPTEVT